jgi:hypothetical protein
MQSDIKFLLLFLVIALVILMYYQHGSSSINATEHRMATKERFINDARENQDSVREGQANARENQANARENQANARENQVNANTHTGKVNEHVLDNLIDDINYTNDLRVNGRNNTEDNAEKDYESRSNSINKAPSHRNISYKSSGYRTANFGKNENQPDNLSELDKFLEDTNVFNNTNENNSSNYSGYDDNNSNFSDNSSSGIENSKFAPANIKEFQSNNNSQKDKIMNLYNSNNYLPNERRTNPELAKGFQILDNPVSVSNPNLIPVLKSIPVSSTLGSKRNSTYDIRAEPANPKTTISPFLNSDIMPDVYATNRGCL